MHKMIITIGSIVVGAVFLFLIVGYTYLAVTHGFPRVALDHTVGDKSFTVAVIERPETSFLTQLFRIVTFSRNGTYTYWTQVTRSGSSLAEVVGTLDKQPYRKSIQVDASQPPKIVVTYEGLDPQEQKSMLLSQ